MKVVAIIPAYNEEARIRYAVRDAFPFVDDVVVVDDCSRDRCGEIAHETGAHVLRHIVNRGQGAALQTGTEYALNELGADIVVHFDGDGQMKGEEIPKMVEEVMAGRADVVLGSRFLGSASNMPFVRKWLTLKPALLFTILISGISLTDTHNGFRALSAEAARKMTITIDRMAHASQILDLIKVHKLRYKECPVTIRYTDETLQKGQSFSGGFIVLKDFFKNRFFG